MKVGYARVSSTGQSLEIQIEKLQAYGCEKIFQEKESGASKQNREELKKALEYVREGDELVITRLNRLARSLRDLTNITGDLDDRKVDFVVLDQQIDTTTAQGRLMFHFFAAMAEFDRDLINELTTEGIAKAKAAGVKFGRRPKLTEKQKAQLKEDFQNTPPEGRKALAERYGISKSSLYRLKDRLFTVRER